jgi:hypothetical protein
VQRKIKHIPKERVRTSQKNFEEKLRKESRGREFLEQLDEIMKSEKVRLERERDMKKREVRTDG